MMSILKRQGVMESWHGAGIQLSIHVHVRQHEAPRTADDGRHAIVTVHPLDSNSVDLLEQNGQRLLQELHRKLREYESRYELSSNRVEAALATGQLRDTAEVCDWVVALRTLQALVHER